MDFVPTFPLVLQDKYFSRANSDLKIRYVESFDIGLSSLNPCCKYWSYKRSITLWNRMLAIVSAFQR